MELFAATIVVLAGFGVTTALIPWLIKYSATRVARDFHQTHQVPISRFGGVALFLAFIAILILAAILNYRGSIHSSDFVIAIGALGMFSVGFVDDVRPLGAKMKLLLQISIAISLYFAGVQIEIVKNPLTGHEFSLGRWGIIPTTLWIVALTNLINLVDGLDGLAGGIVLMLFGLLAYAGLDGPAWQFLICIGMVGAVLGFLCYNFPPAKIYMGDGGAYFLGYLIAALTVVNSQKGTIAAALVAPAFALALPILDVCWAILRRGLNGLPIFRPDKKHIHHRLLAFGFSRTSTVLILYGLSLVFLLLAFGVFWSQGRWIPVLFGFVCVTLLISMKCFTMSRDWWAVGRVLGNSLEVRKETRYALILSSWLEMEAERTSSIGELWGDFQFVLKKLGFACAKLDLGGTQQIWQADKIENRPSIVYSKHEMSFDGPCLLELGMRISGKEAQAFELLNELAAEAWFKAANRWHNLNKLPLRFESTTGHSLNVNDATKVSVPVLSTPESR